MDQVKFVISTLEKLYPKTDVPLDHKDPYTLLIAVLLSAQSTDAGVNKITAVMGNCRDTSEVFFQLTN